MRNIVFRFFFIYFLLTTAFIFWFDMVPGVSYLQELYSVVDEWIVNLFNKHMLHVKDLLNTQGYGSGDTSFAWAQFWTYIILSFVGCIVWTVIDRERTDYYNTLDYALRTMLRYYVSLVAFIYGVIKLYSLQMPFPNLSQLATPLGDFLPMRFSWMFIGYSTPYQVFSGAAETIVALLMLTRRTTTLGALMGIGVFANVFILNLSYDIPVKLFSMQLMICCVYLAARDWQRLMNFFLLNKIAEPADYYPEFHKKWQKIVRIAWKVTFVILFIVLRVNETHGWYKSNLTKNELKPVKVGVYAIKTFVTNGDTVPVRHEDQAWKDFIFDYNGRGSIATTDTLFRQLYRRGYFIYQPDTTKETIAFKRSSADTTSLFELNYRILSDSSFGMWGTVRDDSLYFELVNSRRHYQLAEKQFHWISEANR